MNLEMDLEPEMPEGVSVIKGTDLHRVEGFDTPCNLWIPAHPDALTKLRAVIDRLLYESQLTNMIEPGALIGGRDMKYPDEQSNGACDGCYYCGRYGCPKVGENRLFCECANRLRPPRDTVAKTSATVLLFLFSLLLPAGAVRAQSAGDLIRLADEINARVHERPASELSKPCRVGTRIKVSGVWYDCKARPQTGNNHQDATADLVVLKTNRDRLYRSRLNAAAAQPANFMRHWVLTYWGCGTDCIMGAAVDKDSGRVVWLPFYLTEWSRLEAPLPPLVFSKRNGSLFIPYGVLVFDRGAGYAPQHWRLFRGKFGRRRK